jgi:hypothetical protein
LFKNNIWNAKFKFIWYNKASTTQQGLALLNYFWNDLGIIKK